MRPATHGRLVAITDARGGVMRFSHDPFGRVVAQTDALGHVTRYEYAAGAGGFSTPTAMIRPDGVRFPRAFTEDGVLASVTDGEGRSWRYAYGAFDVLQSIQDPGGGKLSFAHDGEGRVTAVTDQVGASNHLIRDVAGRVAEEDFDGRRLCCSRLDGPAEVRCGRRAVGAIQASVSSNENGWDGAKRTPQRPALVPAAVRYGAAWQGCSI